MKKEMWDEEQGRYIEKEREKGRERQREAATGPSYRGLSSFRERQPPPPPPRDIPLLRGIK